MKFIILSFLFLLSACPDPKSSKLPPADRSPFYGVWQRPCESVLSSNLIIDGTKTNPIKLTYFGSFLPTNGQSVTFHEFRGLDLLNNQTYKVANVDAAARTFTLQTSALIDVDGTGFPPYRVGGEAFFTTPSGLWVPYSAELQLVNSRREVIMAAQDGHGVYERHYYSDPFCKTLAFTDKRTSWFKGWNLIPNSPYQARELNLFTFGRAGIAHTQEQVDVLNNLTSCGYTNWNKFNASNIGVAPNDNCGEIGFSLEQLEYGAYKVNGDHLYLSLETKTDENFRPGILDEFRPFYKISPTWGDDN